MCNPSILRKSMISYTGIMKIIYYIRDILSIL